MLSVTTLKEVSYALVKNPTLVMARIAKVNNVASVSRPNDDYLHRKKKCAGFTHIGVLSQCLQF